MSVFDLAKTANIDLTRQHVSSDRRLVWVPVKHLDDRALAAVDHALRIPAVRHCAVHVAAERSVTIPLAVSWMKTDTRVPLMVVDDVGGVAPSVACAIDDELDAGYDEVVVVLSRLAPRRGWQRVFGDRGAERIQRELANVPGVWVVVLGVPEEAGRAWTR